MQYLKHITKIRLYDRSTIYWSATCSDFFTVSKFMEISLNWQTSLHCKRLACGRTNRRSWLVRLFCWCFRISILCGHTYASFYLIHFWLSCFIDWQGFITLSYNTFLTVTGVFLKLACLKLVVYIIYLYIILCIHSISRR